MIPAYRLRNISFTYGGPPALELDDLDIPQGKIVLLVGPNGSGKTTLLHLLAFLETPQTGQIEFFGEKSHAANLLELRRMAGLLLQNPYLFHETVMSNMIWGLRLRGISGGDARRDALRALDLVGLKGFEDRYARSLSGGEAQRVALARALVLEPKVLLLDEPSNHMDRASALRTEEIVRELNRNDGATVIMTTHAVDQVQSLAHRVIHLWQGKVVSAGPENLFQGVLRNQGRVFDTGHILVHLEAPTEGCSFVTVDPSRIEIGFDGEPNVKNSFPGTVVSLAVENRQVRVGVDAGERFQVLLSVENGIVSRLRLGGQVWVVLGEHAVKVF